MESASFRLGPDHALVHVRVTLGGRDYAYDHVIDSAVSEPLPKPALDTPWEYFHWKKKSEQRSERVRHMAGAIALSLMDALERQDRKVEGGA